MLVGNGMTAKQNKQKLLIVLKQGEDSTRANMSFSFYPSKEEP